VEWKGRVRSMRSYWVASPNVRNNASEWRQASVRAHAAFMGWGPDHEPHGYRFAHEIAPGDVILIARRHKSKPQIVGFGVVRGDYARSVKGVETPDTFGSLRRLSPFIARSESPKNIHIIDVLRHTSALAKLHPNRAGGHYKAHRLVCTWMERLLSRNGARDADETKPTLRRNLPAEDAHIASAPENYQLDYTRRSKRQVAKARKKEAILLMSYGRWLKAQGRRLATIKSGKLQCDAFEEKRGNLIEAKSSIGREYVRMAVGQVLDYAFHVPKKLRNPNMAILFPEEPDWRALDWLPKLNISVIWKEKGKFLDNANGQFT
jgi:hypothetical protein